MWDGVSGEVLYSVVCSSVMVTCGLCAVYTWQVPPRLCVFEYLARVLAQNEFCWRGLAVATESRALGAGFGALGLLFASSSSTDEARRVERYIVGPVTGTLCVGCAPLLSLLVVRCWLCELLFAKQGLFFLVGLFTLLPVLPCL